MKQYDYLDLDYKTINHLLLYNALAASEKTIFTIIRDGDDDEESYTYGKLLKEIQKVVYYFQSINKTDKKILLICNTGIEFIYSFYGSLFSNIVIIPSKIPESEKEFYNIKLIIENAEIGTLFTTSKYQQYLLNGLHNVGCDINCLAVDELEYESVDLGKCLDNIQANDIAMIQYTSGTTSSPKGIMISHRNIIESEKATIKRFKINKNSSIVGWIPVYHSMGIINNVIHPIFADIPCALLSPEHFITNPIRWFRAISKHSATISGGPNFAFDLCINKINLEDCKGLDLSSWKIAFCGSESIRENTIKNFLTKFKTLGIKENLICPCYGLTESTLIVSASVKEQFPNVEKYGEKGTQKSYVSCGPVVDDQILKIVDTNKKYECISGEIGEIWVSGSIIANGYYQNVDATRVFQNKLSHDDNTYLATGDLGFIKNDELYIVGRKKNMLILNGKNYYSEDIEECIEHIDKRNFGAGCIVFSENNDEKGEKLVVIQEILGDTDAEFAEQSILKILETVSQNYSIEVADVVIIEKNQLPKTSSGKKQHLLCKEKYYNNEFKLIAQRNHSGELNSKSCINDNKLMIFAKELASIMNIHDTLNEEQIKQPLYALGADSIGSLQIQNYLLVKYNLSLSLSEIRKLSLDSLYNLLSTSHCEINLLMGETQSNSESFPLNDLQNAYVIGRNGEYELSKIATHVYFEFETGELETNKLIESFKKLINHHDMLRDCIIGDGTQKIINNYDINNHIKVIDLSSLNETDANIVFKNTRKELSHKIYQISDNPYFDLVLLLRENVKRICLSVDLFIADARSIFILLSDWKKLYLGEALKPLKYSFKQYILDDLKNTVSTLYKKADKYWNEKISKISKFPLLPVKKKEIIEIKFNRSSKEIHKDIWLKIKHKARQYNVSLPSVLLTVYAEVLSIWSGMSRFSVNVTNLERKPFHEEVEKLIGQFASFFILDVDLSNKARFIDKVQFIQSNMWECLDNRHIGGTRILQKIRNKTKQYVEAIMPIVFTCVLEDVSEFEWLGNLGYGISQTSQVWLDNQVYEKNGDLLIEWDYVSEMFPEGMIEEMQDMYCFVLKRLALEENLWDEYSVRKLPDKLIEKRRIANTTDHKTQMEFVHKKFLKIVQKYPNNIALIYENQKITYDKLKTMSEKICASLYEHRQPTSKYKRVAIIMEKGWEQIVAVLGILFAGCAYLPIDAALPSERINFMLNDASIDIVLTQNRLLEKSDLFCNRKVIDVTTESIQKEMKDPIVVDSAPDELAYIIYTSGSTGKPKGAIIKHDGLVNAIESTVEKFGINENDVCINITNLHHDMSVFDIFGMLCTGGCVVIPNEWHRKNPSDLAELINTYSVTIWNSVPSIIDVYIEYLEYNTDKIPKSLKTIFLGGDWIKIKSCEKLFSYIEELRIVSVGGPTETTLWNIWYPFKEINSEWTSVPYGFPISNTKYYILDDKLNECPNWIAGNICSTGIGTIKGYINDYGKYSDKFAVHPITGEQLFVSGDLGRYL
ncbi:MAG: AMP-binding protein, partial [Ruminiclostridium sp.]